MIESKIRIVKVLHDKTACSIEQGMENSQKDIAYDL